MRHSKLLLYIFEAEERGNHVRNKRIDPLYLPNPFPCPIRHSAFIYFLCKKQKALLKFRTKALKMSNKFSEMLTTTQSTQRLGG